MHQDIKRCILRYLSANPSARDSVDGIHVWWLPPNSGATLPDVEQALAELVKLGWVQARGEHGMSVYGLETAAMQKIEKYLAEGQDRG